MLEGDVRLRPQRSRPCRYGEEVVAALKKVWERMDYITGKRLAAALPDIVPRRVELREIRIPKSVQKQRLEISPAASGKSKRDYLRVGCGLLRKAP